LKRLIIISSIFFAAALVGALLLPALMRTPSPEETVPLLAEQELLFFRTDLESFKLAHTNRPPTSVTELVSSARFLSGVVEPHRTKILRRLEYPISVSPLLGARSPAVAAYHFVGFGDFFLLTDGTVFQRRLTNYTADSYRRAQREEMEAIKRQVDEAANRASP
jgi:hypothetical protein